MNLVIRKLKMIEDIYKEEEIRAKIMGYQTNTIDYELKNNIDKILDKIK